MSLFDIQGLEETGCEEIGAFVNLTATLEVGGEVLDLTFIRKGELRNGFFLISSIRKGEEELWSAKKQGTNGLWLIVMAGGEPSVVFSGKESKKLERARTIESILSGRPAGGGESLRLKRDAAEFLDTAFGFEVEVEMTAVEELAEKRQKLEQSAAQQRVLDAILEARKAEEERERKAEEERAAARKQKIDEIMFREPLQAVTRDGRRRSGRPVLKDEWTVLPSGTHVILVEAFGEGGKPLQPWTYFMVQKGGGKAPSKFGESAVTPPPLTTEAIKETAVRKVFIEIDGDFHEVLVFPNADAIAQAHKAGLNSGTLVATESADKQGRHEVVALGHSGPKTIGKFKPVRV